MLKAQNDMGKDGLITSVGTSVSTTYWILTHAVQLRGYLTSLRLRGFLKIKLMIKTFLIPCCLFLFSYNTFSQELILNTKDTVVDGMKYIYKEWLLENSKLKHVEFYWKNDSSLYCNYDLIEGQLTGINKCFI